MARSQGHERLKLICRPLRRQPFAVALATAVVTECSVPQAASPYCLAIRPSLGHM